MRFRMKERLSVEKWKQDENASAGKSIFLRFGRDETDTFKNALVPVGALVCSHADKW